jgi:hypothetical protein
MKTGARLVKHARYYWLLLPDGHLTRRLLGAIVQRLAALSVPAGYFLMHSISQWVYPPPLPSS